MGKRDAGGIVLGILVLLLAAAVAVQAPAGHPRAGHTARQARAGHAAAGLTR